MTRGTFGPNVKRVHTEQNPCSSHTVVRLAPPLEAVKKTCTVDRAQNSADSLSLVWHDAATASARIWPAQDVDRRCARGSCIESGHAVAPPERGLRTAAGPSLIAMPRHGGWS